MHALNAYSYPHSTPYNISASSIYTILILFNLYVASGPPEMQACSFDIQKFHQTCPVIPHHKPWLMVQEMNNDFFIDHSHPFGAASVSSNASMMGNAIIDIWICEDVNPIVKYENDVNVYQLHGHFVEGGFSYDYDKHEAACWITSLHIPWHEAKGDPPSFFLYKLTLVFCGTFPTTLSPFPLQSLSNFMNGSIFFLSVMMAIKFHSMR